jgi:hypothetical protein
LCFIRGIGTPINGPEGVRWLKSASEAGQAWSLRDYGLLNLGPKFVNAEPNEHQENRLRNALGVIRTVDQVLGRELLEKAALQGDYEAAAALSVVYRRGFGVTPDLVKSIAYGLVARTVLRECCQLDAGYTTPHLQAAALDTRSEQESLERRGPREVIVPAIAFAESVLRPIPRKWLLNDFCDLN